MTIIDLIFLAIALSMDAFAVSITTGLHNHQLSFKNYAQVGLWFGGFQGLMPILGFFVSRHFATIISSFSHWIAFAILLLIGINMIIESFKELCDENRFCNFHFRNMLLLAIATSIDALASGVSLALLDVNIWTAAILICVITFCFACLGLWVGHKFGKCNRSIAGKLGGVCLILIGVKILLEGLL